MSSQLLWRSLLVMEECLSCGQESASMGDCIDLHVLQGGSMIAIGVLCLNEILQPYAGAISPNFLFMDGSVWIPWLACSPDFKPNEHAWNMLQTAIFCQAIIMHVHSLEQLGKSSRDEDHEDILIMPRWCQEVIADECSRRQQKKLKPYLPVKDKGCSLLAALPMFSAKELPHSPCFPPFQITLQLANLLPISVSKSFSFNFLK